MSDDLLQLLRRVSGEPDSPRLHRRLRLLFVGACRGLWDELSEHSRAAVLTAERYADGAATGPELRNAKDAADVEAVERDGEAQQVDEGLWDVSVQFETSRPDDTAVARARAEIDAANRRLEAAMLAHAATFPDDWLRGAFPPDSRIDPALIRCVFGDALRTTPLSPAWRTSAVVDLARSMYESRDFAAMPILADALQEAGCDHSDVLAHCRGDGPHVRGCWVVDAVLGRS